MTLEVGIGYRELSVWRPTAASKFGSGVLIATVKPLSGDDPQVACATVLPQFTSPARGHWGKGGFGWAATPPELNLLPGGLYASLSRKGT